MKPRSSTSASSAAAPSSPAAAPITGAASVSPTMRRTAPWPAGASPAAVRDAQRRQHFELLEAHPEGPLSRAAWDQLEARRLRDAIEGRAVVLHTPEPSIAEGSHGRA